MNTDNIMDEDKPASRAARLMAAALAAEAAHKAEAELSPLNPTGGSGRMAKASSARPGLKARELNRRIREVLREQEEAVFAAPCQNEQAAPDETASAALGSCAAAASPGAASSWEDIANEIAPGGAGAGRRRGLATGAMRGPSLPDAGAAQGHGPNRHVTWWAEPEQPRVIPCPTPAPDAPLHLILNGLEHLCPEHGAHYRIVRAAAQYDAAFANLGARLHRVLERKMFPALSGARLEDLLFVDIETTGLSSAVPLFLIGALRLDGPHMQPQLELLLARDYPEERALLAAFHRLAAGRTLVTFNGKSFDWPYIEGRSLAHRLTFQQPRAHFDLLHHARRQWKHSLPNCKLQTLELYLCGRTRIDDVPGSQIPRTYHEFVATHAASGAGAHLMAPVLHHNALDILTMAELLCLAGETGA